MGGAGWSWVVSGEGGAGGAATSKLLHRVFNLADSEIKLNDKIVNDMEGIMMRKVILI